MIVKGIVSAIDKEAKTVSVILPEYNNTVTRPIRLFQEDSIRTLSINDFVMVVVFNDNFDDLMVIAPTCGNTQPEGGSTDSSDVILTDRATGIPYLVYVENGELKLEAVESGITVTHDGEGNVYLSGVTVTHDGEGNVYLSGVTVTHDGEGNATIA